MGPRTRLDAVVKGKVFCPFYESNLGHPAHGLVTTLTELLKFIKNYSQNLVSYLEFFFVVISMRFEYCSIYRIICLDCYIFQLQLFP